MVDGNVSDEKVTAVLAVLRKSPPRNYKQLLEVYMAKIRDEIRKGKAEVEYAGRLEDATIEGIKKNLSDHYNRDITVSLKENPKLLAGFRIHVADDVWDATVNGRLENFSQSF